VPPCCPVALAAKLPFPAGAVPAPGADGDWEDDCGTGWEAGRDSAGEVEDPYMRLPSRGLKEPGTVAVDGKPRYRV
jgi:hypothetical protein